VVSEPTAFDRAWGDLVVAIRGTPVWRGMERLVGWLARQRWMLWLDRHIPAWFTLWGWRYWQWWLVVAITLIVSVLIGLLIRTPMR
jgi:hypothetical protein